MFIPFREMLEWLLFMIILIYLDPTKVGYTSSKPDEKENNSPKPPKENNLSSETIRYIVIGASVAGGITLLPFIICFCCCFIRHRKKVSLHITISVVPTEQFDAHSSTYSKEVDPVV